MKLLGVTDCKLLPNHLIRQLYSLTFRYKSPMKKALRDLVSGARDGTVVWTEADGKVQAWGLLVDGIDGKPEVMLYTRRSAQGGGLATQVFWGLRNTLKEPDYTYYPHDARASKFYMRQYERRCKGEMLRPEVIWLAQ